MFSHTLQYRILTAMHRWCWTIFSLLGYYTASCGNCVYSCTQYSLHTQYMLLTYADDLLCLQLHTVQSPYTVHASNTCWWLAVPTAAHSRVLVFPIHLKFSLVSSYIMNRVYRLRLVLGTLNNTYIRKSQILYRYNIHWIYITWTGVC
jgi:hypothetical protein